MIVDKVKVMEPINLVAEIETTKRNIINNKYELLQNDIALKEFEKKIMGEIANEIDEKTAKPVYSNEAKRQLEFTLRTETDQDYINLKDYIKELQRKRDEYYMELEVMEKVYEIKIEEAKLKVR